MQVDDVAKKVMFAEPAGDAMQVDEQGIQQEILSEESDESELSETETNAMSRR